MARTARAVRLRRPVLPTRRERLGRHAVIGSLHEQVTETHHAPGVQQP